MVVVDEQQRVALIRKAYGRRDWDVPGGMVEIGETIGDAAVRETLEEASLVVSAAHLCGVVHMPSTAEHPGMLVFGFVADAFAGDLAITQPEEIGDIGWFGPDQWPAGLADHARRLIAFAGEAARGGIFEHPPIVTS